MLCDVVAVVCLCFRLYVILFLFVCSFVRLVLFCSCDWWCLSLCLGVLVCCGCGCLVFFCVWFGWFVFGCPCCYSCRSGVWSVCLVRCDVCVRLCRLGCWLLFVCVCCVC